MSLPFKTTPGPLYTVTPRWMQPDRERERENKNACSRELILAKKKKRTIKILFRFGMWNDTESMLDFENLKVILQKIDMNLYLKALGKLNSNENLFILTLGSNGNRTLVQKL